MKKLMFAAALAATGMTYAATPAAQVYDVTLSIKTTAAASATINSKTNPFLGEEKELVIYRKQANQSWKGLIWGCSCESIDGVWEEVNEVAETGYSTIKGCIIWNTKTKKPVFIGDGADLTDAESAQDKGFGWIFLNAIDKNGKKVEGTWEMTQTGDACEETDELFDFSGAGFGTLNVIGDGTDFCGVNYLKKISGNFAGWMKAPYAEVSTDWSGCTFCGYEPGITECEYSTVWDYCQCLGIADASKTAAYGTWSVVYNSTLSKRLSKPVTISKKGIDNVVVSIRDAYDFSKLPYVGAAIAEIENTFWGLTTTCDDLKAAVDQAQKELDALSDANLWAAVEDARDDYKDATNAQAQAQIKYDNAKADAAETSQYYVAMTNAITSTNLSWRVDYTDKTYKTGTGAQKLIDELAGLRTPITDGIVYGEGTVYYFVEDNKTDATTKLNGYITTAKTTAETYQGKVTACEDAKDELADANDDVKTAEDKLSKANNAWLNRTSLQYNAQQKLEKAEQKYENAGCGIID